MTKDEILILKAELEVKMQEQREIQGIIRDRKAHALAQAVAHEITAESWIDLIHKTNREMKLSQTIFNRLDKQMGQIMTLFLMEGSNTHDRA